jgi:hypothetical protein
MTKDQQKLGILIVLLIVLGVTIGFGYFKNQPATAASVQTPPQKTSANPPAPNDARIMVELVEKPDSGQEIGSRNLFQYRQAPAPPLPPPPRGGSAPNVNTAPPPQPVVTPPVVRPGPPMPPPIALKYQGFAATNAQNRGLTAFLADDARHYNVTVGEILMGRFRIASISDKSVEVEDLEYNRRQSLPLLVN